MGKGAAFFDLDRTLLKRASGPLITEALVSMGLVSPRTLVGQDLLYGMFNIVGETLPSIVLARGAALVAKGWSAGEARRAGTQAAERLETLVTPWARGLLDEHRRAGRPVVMTTTTPHDLVCPLAERLGFDDVLATRYGEVDGVYTGALEGEFVWSTGKRSVVRAWAAAHGVDLSASWAYSDSVYDVPLLADVGHPTAVNPDPRLWLVATLRRWPVCHLDAPPGVPKLAGLEPLDGVRLLTRPEMFPYARFQFAALEHIPRHGPVIAVSNQRSNFDPVALGLALFRVGRKPRFLVRPKVFDVPVLGQLMRSMGQIPADGAAIADGVAGGHADMADSVRAVAAGECLVILSEGDIAHDRDPSGRRLHAGTAAVRLAAATGAPVVPIGLWGTEQVWPRSARLPDVTGVTSPPLVGVRAGPPVALCLDDPAADVDTLTAAISALLPPGAGPAGPMASEFSGDRPGSNGDPAAEP